MRNASGHQWTDIFSIKRVTKKFLDVSRCSRAKQRQRNVQKKCAARAMLLLLIRLIVVFHRFRRWMPSPLNPLYTKGGGIYLSQK